MLSSSTGWRLTSDDLQVLEPGQGSCDLSGTVDQDSHTIKAFIKCFLIQQKHDDNMLEHRHNLT